LNGREKLTLIRVFISNVRQTWSWLCPGNDFEFFSEIIIFSFNFNETASIAAISA